jgi:hypothetical protein
MAILIFSMPLDSEKNAILHFNCDAGAPAGAPASNSKALAREFPRELQASAQPVRGRRADHELFDASKAGGASVRR